MRKRNAQGVFITAAATDDSSNTRAEPNKWYGQQAKTSDLAKLRRMLIEKGDKPIAEMADTILQNALDEARVYHARAVRRGSVAVNIYARAQITLRRDHPEEKTCEC